MNVVGQPRGKWVGRERDLAMSVINLGILG